MRGVTRRVIAPIERDVCLHAQGLMVSIAREVTARLAGAEAGSFSRQHLANLIWAFATLEVAP